MRKFPHWPLALLLTVALFVYIATLDTGFMPQELEGGDLITHQYAQVQARPSNAPGYPLYTMGGWLWFHGLRGAARLLGNPLPNPIPLLSSYSILWALLALALFYAIIIRLTRHSRPAPRGSPVRHPPHRLLRRHLLLLVLRHHHRTIQQRHRPDLGDCVCLFVVGRMANGEWR